MNVTKYLDFDSSYRDISAFPNPSIFEIPLAYYSYTGSTVSQQQLVDYEITLDYLILPNTTVSDDKYAGKVQSCPYVYVELQNATSGLYNIMYSNNPSAKRMLFKALIDDYAVPDTTKFIKLKSVMTQTIKFKPNDNLRFGVYLPDGTPFKTDQIFDGTITSIGTTGQFYYNSSITVSQNNNNLVLQGSSIKPPTSDLVVSSPLTGYTSGNSYAVISTGSDAGGNYITLSGITVNAFVTSVTSLINPLNFNVVTPAIVGTIIKVGPSNKLYYSSSPLLSNGNVMVLTGTATINAPLIPNYISGTVYKVSETGTDGNGNYIKFTGLIAANPLVLTEISGLTFYNPLNQISALFSIKRL
jgi:hypothetical protein